MKNDMQEIFRQVVAEWKDYKLPDMVDRDIKIVPGGSSIAAVVGVRRAGKTYMIFKIWRQLPYFC